jgi:ABC-2 type transport system ATP-binding protein
MALTVEHLTRTYAGPGVTSSTGFTAVDDFSFEGADGEIIGLIGPNGAGKTTTLRTLAGILRPTSGRVAIDGHDIVADSIAAKRRLAFMPDEPHLFEYLTVEEHLRLVARLYTVEDFDRRARALIEELELTGKERSLPGELSRGMRQKVVIACGLVRDATTLLFDEPLTGLDPVGIHRMRETIVARGRAGACVLVSSHLLHMVEEICTRVIIMDHGRKVADGTVAELASRADLAVAGSSLEQIFLRVTGHGTSPQS